MGSLAAVGSPGDDRLPARLAEEVAALAREARGETQPTKLPRRRKAEATRR